MVKFPSQSIIKREVRVAEWLNEPYERRDTLQEVSCSGERQNVVFLDFLDVIVASGKGFIIVQFEINL